MNRCGVAAGDRYRRGGAGSIVLLSESLTVGGRTVGMVLDFEASYLVWALIALTGYTIFTPLARIATQQVPSTVVALV
ncbi:hypothetical protein BRC86_04580, partial [Halobacteriales archaeon QS_3_64_16]